MNLSTILASLTLAASSTLALPSSSPSPPPPFPLIKLPARFFALMALRSATPIHFGAVQANHAELWIGKNASTYCPGTPGLDCSDVVTTHTTYHLSNGVLGLGVQAEGGQRIYVDDCGRLGYSFPGDRSLPYGAITTGWSLEPWGQFRLLSHVNGTYFCPPSAPQQQPEGGISTDDDDDDEPTATPAGSAPPSVRTSLPGAWQFYVGVVDLPRECLYASLLAQGNENTTTAYEYL